MLSKNIVERKNNPQTGNSINQFSEVQSIRSERFLRIFKNVFLRSLIRTCAKFQPGPARGLQLAVFKFQVTAKESWQTSIELPD